MIPLRVICLAVAVARRCAAKFIAFMKLLRAVALSYIGLVRENNLMNYESLKSCAYGQANLL